MSAALATADRRLACHGRECGGCEGGGSGRERVLIRYMAACRARAQGWCALCLTLRGFGAGLPPPLMNIIFILGGGGRSSRAAPFQILVSMFIPFISHRSFYFYPSPSLFLFHFMSIPNHNSILIVILIPVPHFYFHSILIFTLIFTSFLFLFYPDFILFLIPIRFLF